MTFILALIFVSVALISALAYGRFRFMAGLDQLETTLKTAAIVSTPREDLPPEVLALAAKHGTQSHDGPRFIRLHQEGQMWMKPDARPMAFKATQLISLATSDFIWLARFSPFSLIMVVDYLVSGIGGLEGRLFGAFRLMRDAGSPEALRGELMRYLAELAFAPDAISCNRSLDWRVIDAQTLIVGCGQGDQRAEVTLTLNADGLIERIDAANRPAKVGKTMIERPWGGRFWDYQTHEGRTVPMQGEVYWLIDGKPFVYWRGAMMTWSVN